MSADDFQTKYASVMESMLKGAVAETTKLFETMVDELKAEITKIKKENEDLKRKCSQFEDARGKTADDIQERESDPRRSDGSEKRDTAIQCDLVPFRTMLVEQCEPLQPSSWQNQVQQCGFDTMQYVWQEHNYENREGRNSQMAVILVKQEDLVDSPQQSVFKQEEGSPLMSAGVTEKEGHIINQECPSAEIPSSQGNEDTRVALELPHVGLDSSLLGVHNQLSESGDLLSVLKGDMEKGSDIGVQVSEIMTQGELVTIEKHPQNQPEVELHENERPADGKVSVNEQTDTDLPRQMVDTKYTEEQSSKPTPPSKSQASDESKNATSVAEPPPPVRRRRGRPPKKAKHRQQLVKQVLLPSSTVSAEQEVKNSSTTRVGKRKASIAESLNITSSKSSQRSRIHPKESSPFKNLSVQGKVNTFLEDKENSTVGSLAFLGSPQSRKPSFENKKASETHQLSMITKDGAVQAPPIELSSTVEKQNTPSTESPQESSLQSRERCTSATLQDAMLLVEAMNQSTEESTQCSPQKVAATTQTLQTFEGVPVESERPSIPGHTGEAASHVPPQTTDTTATTEALAHIKNITPKQQHPVPLSNADKPSVATSTAATQTSVKSFQQHPSLPPQKSVTHSKLSDAVHHKIIVMSRSSGSLMPSKFAGKPLTQLPSVVSTVIAAQNNGELPKLTPTSTSPGKPPLCSGSQKTLHVAPQKLLPVISPQSTPPPADPQSGSQSKITILIPRQQSAVASRKQSQATDLSMKQTPSRLMSSSLEFRVSDDAQITFDEAAPITEDLEPYQQTVSPPKTMNEPSDTSSSSDMSYGPTPMSPASPPTAEHNPSAVVRLIRLPFQMSTKEAVLLSSLSTSESSDTESVSKESTMKEKPSSLVLSVQPLETQVSPSDTCCISKGTSVAVSDKTSQMSEIVWDIREGASLLSEKDSVLDESSDSEHVQSSAAPVLNSTTAINTTESSTVPDDPPVESQSPAVIHLLSIKSRDTTDPHVQMTKTQFLAQLAVSPILQDQNETFNCDSIDADASCLISTSNKESIQRNTFMAKLRCHLKTHLQVRNSERNQEPCTEIKTLNASPKKPRLETNSPDDPTTGPTPRSPDGQGTVVDTTSPEKTEIDPSPLSSRKSGVCKDSVRSKRSVSEPALVSTRRPKAMGDSTLVSHGGSDPGKDCVSSKNKFTSVSPRSTSAKESASLKKTKSTSPSPRGSSSTKERISPKKIKTSTVRKTSSLRDNTSPKRDDETPKKTRSIGIAPRTSRVKKNDSSPKMTNNHSTSFCRRRCTVSQVGSSTKPTESESNFLSPKSRGITADGTATDIIKSGTNLQSVEWVKLTESVISSKTGESTPTQKHKLTEEGSGPNENLRVTKSKKLAKAAEATTEAKINKSAGSPENVKKLSATGVWTPPILPASKTSPAGGKRSPNSTPITKTPKQTIVYPPSVPLHPIPVRAPPVVSPLQPLSVIGWRLLKNQCGECGRILSSSAALESHVSLHTGHRPFSCKLCGKRFPDSKGLKRHGRVHRNGRIHVCQQCGKGFVYSFGLTKHLQMVHSRIKPFVCQVCNKGFYSKRDVEAHIRIHTGEKPFHCNLCEKKFARRTELNVHLRWHNGEKRHWCPYCGKGFLDINNLKRHKYIHTGEKPHSCPHCPKHFTQSGHLKKHVKNVHKIQ